MRKARIIRMIAMTAGLLLVFGMAPLWAEDSHVFNNSADTLQAQEVLVREGYLSQGAFTPGILDGHTQRALSQYQSAHSLNDRGLLDDETYQSLTSHHLEYPWGGEGEALSEPSTVETASTPKPEVAEAPRVPNPTPAPAEVKEAPAQESATPETAAQEPSEEKPSRSMPATGSSLPLLALSGLVLTGIGVLLLRQNAA